VVSEFELTFKKKNHKSEMPYERKASQKYGLVMIYNIKEII